MSAEVGYIHSLTKEQQEILRHSTSQLLITAYAGTGKTTTLAQFALQHATMPMLYLAYNRAIREEAALRFPSNVTCKTGHQLAYQQYGQYYCHKLQAHIRALDIAKVIAHEDWRLVSLLQQTLSSFLWSDAPEITKEHIPTLLTQKQLRWRDEDILEATRLLWTKMCDRSDPFPMTHDGYLKQYQLYQPNLSTKYAALLFDEAQDANPVISDIVLRQTCKLLLVGDPHQQIYRWRGAVNSFSSPHLRGNSVGLYLSHSFRFGPAIAKAANAILQLKGATQPLIGAGKTPGKLLFGKSITEPKTILHRTVLGVIHTALSLCKANKRLYWVGGIDAYQLTYLLDLYFFSLHKLSFIKDKRLIQDYQSYAKFCLIAEATGESEMNRSIALIERYPQLPSHLKNLRSQTTEEESEADIVLSTVHRSKGLEWNHVEMADDFFDPFSSKNDPNAITDELNLLYVAATRATTLLSVNPLMQQLMKKASRLTTHSSQE